MNFDFSDDQKFLKDEARKFLDANCPTARVRGVLDDEGKAYDAALWKAVAEQGWLGAAIPEEYGGLGLGHLELCAIAEELGRVVAPIPFASTVYFVAEAVMLAGNEEQKSWLLPKIAAGEVICCMATSEGPGPATEASLKTTVKDGKISGVKLPVTDGDIANIALVLAKENGKPGLYSVDLDGEGVTREVLQTLDPTRDAAKLTFKDVHRLNELETLVPRLGDQIKDLEGRLEDPGLYARDRAGFDKLMSQLERKRVELAGAEEEWLKLEEKRESLGV